MYSKCMICYILKCKKCHSEFDLQIYDKKRTCPYCKAGKLVRIKVESEKTPEFKPLNWLNL